MVYTVCQEINMKNKFVLNVQLPLYLILNEALLADKNLKSICAVCSHACVLEEIGKFWIFEGNI